MSALTFASADPERLAEFWGGLLGQAVTIRRGVRALAAVAEVGFELRFVAAADQMWGPNQLHPDLLPNSLDEQAATVERALARGARHLDIGQGQEVEHVVLADPDGNELCVLEPEGASWPAVRSSVPWPATAGPRSATSGGTHWPGAWSGTATARPRSRHRPAGPRSPGGGEPVRPKLGRNRLHLDLTPSPPSTVEIEID